MSVKYIIGLDPSFSGAGVAVIDLENKKISLREFSVDLGERTFPYVCKAAMEMTTKLIDNNPEFINKNTLVGIEIPPTQGLFSVKLWALDAYIYNNLIDCKKYLFSTAYLRYIHKKKSDKKDTMNLISIILDLFKEEGFIVEQTLLDKRNKPRKFTSNQCDAMLYATRIYCKYHLENGIIDNVTPQIIELNDRFAVNKEEFFRENT